MNHQPRDDYRELLELTLIFLGKMCHREIKFRLPGAMHQARWMSKAIYSLKVWMFRSQFQLTKKESCGLREFNVFIIKVYVKSWFLAPQASTAAKNDFLLLQKLQAYPNPKLSAATTEKFKRHLWYLSEDLILLSLFDPEIDSSSKQAMVEASLKREGMRDPPKRLVVDMKTFKQNSLCDFVTKNSRNIFKMLCLPDAFLTEHPDSWKDRDDYMAAQAIVCSLATTNDHAERGVALIQDCTKSGRFKNEDQLQYALQVIEDSRKKYPDTRKSTLLMDK